VRLLLIDNLLFEHDGVNRHYDLGPHLGLASLAAVARLGGHDAEIYDPKQDLARGALHFDASLYRQMAQRISARQPDVAGFTALGSNLHCVAKTAALVRRLCPDLPILLGGPHATILHDKVLARFPAFDAVVRSEAEETLLPLLDGLANRRWEELPGVSYRSRQGEIRCNPASAIVEDLDRLPFPAYDCYPIAELGLTQIAVEAGRGCPFSCSFCSTASFFGRRYRLKSTDRLVGEMDRLNAAYGFTDFGLNHDLFTVNRKKILAFCEAVRGRGYIWSCSARVDCVDPELLRAMAGAGCNNIYFGIETGSPRMQKVSCKHLDLDLVEPVTQLCDALGFKVTASFITGYPEEEAGDQAATLDMAGRLLSRPSERTQAQLHLLTPEPGTALMAQYGESLRFDGHGTDHNFPILEHDDAALLEGEPELFSGHHYFPSVQPRRRHVFVVTAWAALMTLGPGVLRYLLSAYGGRLGALMDAMHDWREGSGVEKAAVEPAQVIDFLADHYGAGHSLVSLCRLAFAMRAARLVAEQPRARRDAPRRRLPLVLAPHAAVLTDIQHPKWLAALVDREFDARADSPRVSVLVRADSPTRSAAAFEIDRWTVEILRRFAQPMDHARLCRALRGGNAPLPAWTVIRDFWNDGVLEPAPMATALAAE
jgi:radical SAM superfamily enzyme YgiQ (UPF0313 family)